LTATAETGDEAASSDFMELSTLGRQATAPRPQTAQLDGLWVVLVANDGEVGAADADGRAPMMAQSGSGQLLLLAFRTAATARSFVADQEIDDVQYKMIVGQNKEELIELAKAAGALGCLVDYDPATQAYVSTAALA
jgi:hypothetical protein